MTISDQVRLVVSRHQAGITDRDTVLEQLRIIVERSGVDPVELLLVLADGDLKHIAALQAEKRVSKP